MKRLILVSFAILSGILSSCEDRYVSGGREMYRKYFEKVLIDPSSFKVYEESYTADGMAVKWKLDYGAKNRYGAMIRETKEFTTHYPHFIDIDGDMVPMK